MDSASFQFVLFGLIAALLLNLNHSRGWRFAVLLAASLLFLGLISNTVALWMPLTGFLAAGYLGQQLIERRRLHSPALAILVMVFVYVWLKKYTFLPTALFISHPYLTLGLSYIFFRVLHLLIDTADADAARHIGPAEYLLYNINFTTLVSGPIQRYDEFAADQFAATPVALGADVIGLQIERIIRGFFKVNVLATLFHAWQEDALGQLYAPLPPGLKVGAALQLSLVYPFFLYANFSGYIDIVMALARLMRLRLPENFDRPFAAASVMDFWNRWHMTLSNWLKTYVYNPLLFALMRRISAPSVQELLGVLCFFVTFFLIGVWHGRTSEFVVFGVLTGGGMAVNKLWQIALTRARGRKGYRALAAKVLYTAWGRGLNFVWFSFTLFWFWGSWPEIDRLYGALPAGTWGTVWLAAWLCATLGLAAWEWLRGALLAVKTADGPVLTGRYARVVFATTLGLAALVMTVLLNQPAPGIVYKSF